VIAALSALRSRAQAVPQTGSGMTRTKALKRRGGKALHLTAKLPAGIPNPAALGAYSCTVTERRGVSSIRVTVAPGTARLAGNYRYALTVRVKFQRLKPSRRTAQCDSVDSDSRMPPPGPAQAAVQMGLFKLESFPSPAVTGGTVTDIWDSDSESAASRLTGRRHGLRFRRSESRAEIPPASQPPSQAERA
jgi:hypothetical protein